MTNEITTIHANDNLPEVPTNPKELAPFITISMKAIEAKKMLLKSLTMSPIKYSEALKNTQNHAALLLSAELRLANILKGIKTRRGLRTDLKQKVMDVCKSKKQIIEEEYGLTPTQAKMISRLTQEGVDAAIETANDNNEIPTRTMALTASTINKPKEERNRFDLKTAIEDSHKSLKLDKPLYYTSLFANVGIGTYYLKDMGIKCAVANEILPKRAKWHSEAYPDCNMIEGDITDPAIFDEVVRLHKEKGCSLLMASPVCRDFSRANNSKNKLTGKRTALFMNTLDFIRETKPKWIVIENVPDFLFLKPKSLEDILNGKTIGEYIRDELKEEGYIVNIGVFSAADYGTAQDRLRAVILASRTDKIWKFPKMDTTRKVLFQAIGDLPSLEPGQSDPKRPLHYALPLPQCQIDFIKRTPSGESAWDNAKKWQPVNIDGSPSGAQFKSSFSRKEWGKPCNTVMTDNGSIGGLINLHPGYPLSDGTCSDCRPLSILELLRVTGLPDDFFIPDWAKADDTLIRAVIGECFIPLFVKRLLTTLPYK